MKTDLFQSCGHCWVFQICWHIECNTFTASAFRIGNSTTGIPSPPLALFVVMLPKAHLTLHATMSGSRWVITPLWSSGSWRSFLYSSSVYSCHLFLISSVRSIPLLSFIESIFARNVKNVRNQMASKWGSQTSASYVWLWRLCCHSCARWHMLRGRVPSSPSIWDSTAPVESPFLCFLTAPVKRDMSYIWFAHLPPQNFHSFLKCVSHTFH